MPLSPNGGQKQLKNYLAQDKKEDKKLN